MAVVDGVRSGHSSEGIATLNLGGVDVAVSVVVVSELILEVIVILMTYVGSGDVIILDLLNVRLATMLKSLSPPL